MVWEPPDFTFFKQADGTLLAIDENGTPLTCQPSLKYKDVDGTQEVVDPWGNTIDEYELPPYTTHVYTDFDTGTETGIAVDADGAPLLLVPPVRIARTNQANGTADVVLPGGGETTVPTYAGPAEYSVHVQWSSSRLEQGSPEYELIAVDTNGVPLPVQPRMGGDPADPNAIYASWGKGGPANVPQYEFPRFSMHLDYPEGALRGAGSAPPIPIAIGEDGTPLAIQPTFEADPIDPTKVVAVLPNGDLYDPPPYEFPRFRVQLEYPPASYGGHTVPIPVPIAVDENGVPLAVQPDLSVDPTDHTQVSATFPDQSTTRVEVQAPSTDFYVHIEASGGEHGAPQYAAVAVDASGTPLPIQPHLEVDPTDPSKVTATMPDGSSYEPPNLYPPAGEPPVEWPPPAEEDTEEDDLEATDGVDNGTELETEDPAVGSSTPEEARPDAESDSPDRQGTADEPEADTKFFTPAEPTDATAIEIEELDTAEALVVAGLDTAETPAPIDEPEADFKFFTPAEPTDGTAIEIEELEVTPEPIEVSMPPLPVEAAPVAEVAPLSAAETDPVELSVPRVEEVEIIEIVGSPEEPVVFEPIEVNELESERGAIEEIEPEDEPDW